ncbi:hypothetical protein FQN49_006645 [Arthroderma sp. PD_2]|nr:hypothetical protein FQN49_006645 [Arthroderma sp. PD_2]
MDARQMANGLVLKQASRLVCQRLSHHAPIRQTRRSARIPQLYTQSIRKISSTRALSSDRRDAQTTSQQPTPKKGKESINVNSISSLLDDVYDRVGTGAEAGGPGQRGHRNVGPEFRSLFQRSDVGSVTRAVRDSVAYSANEVGHSVPTYPELRLNPKLGRTVAVDPTRGVDVNSAFAMMESQVGRNSVRYDSVTQRFHIRRGQKRKMLRGKRWRVLFKRSFVATVNRCMELKRQGW